MSAEHVRGLEEVDGAGLRIALVRSSFNEEITKGLLDGARRVCEKAGAAEIDEFDVPGSFELALVAQRLAESGYDAVVALGAVIEGETDHYDHIATAARDGLLRVMLDTKVPVGFGVLTVRRTEHARARSGPGPTNKGVEAAEAAIRTARMLADLAAR
ncbi:MAG: 6,7-dimethyl-8-ribityllumazine synthase [Acidimicrobiia bacterium]